MNLEFPVGFLRNHIHFCDGCDGLSTSSVLHRKLMETANHGDEKSVYLGSLSPSLPHCNVVELVNLA